jgi:hypothetical protein
MMAWVQLDSEKCEGSLEKLSPGELVEVQETRAASDGTMRICIGKNRWTGLVSQKGENLLTRCPMEDVPLLRARMGVDKKGGLNKLEKTVWENYVENLTPDEQTKAKAAKKRGVKDMELETKKKAKPKLMERAPYHDRLKAAVEYAAKGGFDQDEMVMRTRGPSGPPPPPPVTLARLITRAFLPTRLWQLCSPQLPARARRLIDHLVRVSMLLPQHVIRTMQVIRPDEERGGQWCTIQYARLPSEQAMPQEEEPDF